MWRAWLGDLIGIWHSNRDLRSRFNPVRSDLVWANLIQSVVFWSNLTQYLIRPVASYSTSFHFISFHLISSHLISCHLISSHLISPRCIQPNLICSALIWNSDWLIQTLLSSATSSRQMLHLTWWDLFPLKYSARAGLRAVDGAFRANLLYSRGAHKCQYELVHGRSEEERGGLGFRV